MVLQMPQRDHSVNSVGTPSSFISIGIPLIDAQHRRLLETFHLVVRSLNPRGSTKEFSHRLWEFVEDVRQHFADEERFMQGIGYDALDDHRAEHAKLLESAEAFLGSVESRFEAYDCWAVVRYFRLWLDNHVRDHDSAIGAYVRSHAQTLRGERAR